MTATATGPIRANFQFKDCAAQSLAKGNKREKQTASQILKMNARNKRPSLRRHVLASRASSRNAARAKKACRVVVAARSSFLAALVGAYTTRACHCQVLAVAQSVRGALEKAGAAHSDLWLIDAGLPKLLTPEFKATVAKQTPRVRMIAFSVPAEKQSITSLLACEFTVLLAEDATLAELSQAVRSARANVPFFSSSLVTFTESDYIERALHTTEHPAVQLTRREQEIREAVDRGETSKDIGRKLGVATRTSEKHRQHIRDKLRRQAQAVGRRRHT